MRCERHVRFKAPPPLTYRPYTSTKYFVNEMEPAALLTALSLSFSLSLSVRGHRCRAFVSFPLFHRTYHSTLFFSICVIDARRSYMVYTHAMANAIDIAAKRHAHGGRLAMSQPKLTLLCICWLNVKPFGGGSHRNVYKSFSHSLKIRVATQNYARLLTANNV